MKQLEDDKEPNTINKGIDLNGGDLFWVGVSIGVAVMFILALVFG